MAPPWLYFGSVLLAFIFGLLWSKLRASEKKSLLLRNKGKEVEAWLGDYIRGSIMSLLPKLITPEFAQKTTPQLVEMMQEKLWNSVGHLRNKIQSDTLNGRDVSEIIFWANMLYSAEVSSQNAKEIENGK